MQKDNSFTISARFRSVRYALSGIALMLRSQHNAWIHAASTIFVIFLGFYFGISASEWCWIVIVIVAVWTAEALNTAFELLCDVASPEFHPLVKNAKDVAAGAVLLSAVGASVIGLIIFLPHLLSYG